MARPKSDIEPRIVRAARKQFLDNGVDGASLRRIAHGARTSIGMVYYYFPTKDELFFAVVEETYAKLLADMTEALRPDVPVKERLVRLSTRVGMASDEELAIVRLVLREALVSSSRLDRLLDRFQHGHLPLVFATLSEATADGSIRKDVPMPLVFLSTLAMCALPQLLRRALKTRLPLGPFPDAAAFAELLVRGLFEGIGSGDGKNRTLKGRPTNARRTK